MKIVIISVKDISSGAARASYRLLKGLKRMNRSSYMIVKIKDSEDKAVIPLSLQTDKCLGVESGFKEIQGKYIKQNRSTVSDSAFSFPYPGYDLSKVQLVEGADIVNLHDIRNFQSVETISRLLGSGKQVIWTLHDQMSFTGGCHYSAGCQKYRTDCRDCPQLKDNRHQIPFFVLKNKAKNWRKNLTIVTPSRWLAGCARESRVLRDFRVEHIPNSLETDVFKPVSKAEARKMLKMQPESIAILFGSMHNKIRRKGFLHFLSSVRFCLKDARFKQEVKKRKIQFMTVGKVVRNFDELDFPVFSFGRVDSDSLLSKIYSAADIFVLPSLEDNLPNTMLEAMACGTPVVAFEAGGIPEVVKNRGNGYVVPLKDEEEMGKCILNLVFNEKLRQELGYNASRLMAEEFHLSAQAGRYISLFEDLMQRKFSGGWRDISQNEVCDLPEHIELKNCKTEIDPEIFSELKKVFQKLN